MPFPPQSIGMHWKGMMMKQAGFIQYRAASVGAPTIACPVIFTLVKLIFHRVCYPYTYNENPKMYYGWIWM